MMVMTSFGPMEIKEIVNRLLYLYENANLWLIMLVVVNNVIRLLIPVVINASVVIIKYQIFVNNTSSNYAKINLRSSFLGYSPMKIVLLPR